MYSKNIFFKDYQKGVAAVEFSLIAILFFGILFACFEFGRMLYVFNTMQEVTRRATREATIRWVDEAPLIKKLALFGGTAIPAGAEVTDANIVIEYLDRSGAVISDSLLPIDPADNLSACNDATRLGSCITSVRVSINNASYQTMVGLLIKKFNFPSAIPLPRSSMTAYAESLGFSAN